MKAKLTMLVLVLAFAMLLSTFPLPTISASEPAINETMSLDFHTEPAQCKPFVGCAGEGGEIPYNLDMIDREKVCATGEDVYVAVLDTGLLYNWMEYLPVENIVTEWGKGYSYETIYWDDGWWLDDPNENRGFITAEHPIFGPIGSGHGTHVTSTITGFNYVSSVYGEFWVDGVAPDVKIIPVLVLDAWVGYRPGYGYYLVTGGTSWMVSSGIRYCADLAEEEGIKIVISMSLGAASPMAAVEEAIDYAISKGCIVVAAAGNAGEAGMDYPGAYSQVISAAMGGWTMQWFGDGETSPWWLSDVPERFWTEDELGNEFQLYLDDISGRPNQTLGQSICDLDVCTPGAWIMGPYRPYLGEFGYWYVGGTSMATPHVSGIAALVLEKYPNINQREMELILKTAGIFNRMTKWFEERSATVYDPIAGDLIELTWGPFDYGTGFLQADSAMFTAALFRRFQRHWRPY